MGMYEVYLSLGFLNILKNMQDIKFHLYRNIGKLFFAVSASDKNIREEEYVVLERTLNKEWLNIAEYEYLELVLHTFKKMKTEKVSSELCYQEFIMFKRRHLDLFTDELKEIIQQTALLIASSFSLKNKSELIILAKLNLEFN